MELDLVEYDIDTEIKKQVEAIIQNLLGKASATVVILTDDAGRIVEIKGNVKNQIETEFLGTLISGVFGAAVEMGKLLHMDLLDSLQYESKNMDVVIKYIPPRFLSGRDSWKRGVPWQGQTLSKRGNFSSREGVAECQDGSGKNCKDGRSRAGEEIKPDYSGIDTMKLKIVYFGSSLAGKSTNVKKLYEILRKKGLVKGDMVVMETEEQRTLFVEMFISSINLDGYELELKVLTTPGQFR